LNKHKNTRINNDDDYVVFHFGGYWEALDLGGVIPPSFSVPHISSGGQHPKNLVGGISSATFYLDPPPPHVPDGSATASLLGVGLIAMGALRKRLGA